MAMNLSGGKVKGFDNGAHSADQPTQSDKPLGPFPKSSTASPTKKDGGA
jgi:hypothetical protein